MKHRLLAQLDRRLARRGERIDLMRKVGTPQTSTVYARVPAIIRSLTIEQIIAGVTVQNYFLIISPTDIAKAQWPGGKVSAAPTGTLWPQAADPAMPVQNDSMWMRGAVKSVQRVAPIYDAGVCIRIELYVAG
jgi:hypothetical protein